MCAWGGGAGGGEAGSNYALKRLCAMHVSSSSYDTCMYPPPHITHEAMIP
jgi:hypothetical protein